ncbi:MAG TPA: HesA/MoeB/ThiF family protein [Caulobacteraceae bacterium]|jgi:molybdopterin/thiamine biosynthesis adenylyltransferase|nr:HesA/MoeB/ThiF family protein [Caulobacteraceae bacterium]
MFSDREVERYARHLVLREIGGPGQQKLKAARVLVAGVGGIGGPAALYLAAAGVGRIGLVDDDVVSLSNLQRQIQFGEGDLGRSKVEAAHERIGAVNSDIAVEAFEQRIAADTARDLVRGWNVVIDGTDSFETRALVGDACVAEGATLIAAAVGRWDVQVAVLRAKPCWRCFVPELPPGAETCAAVGVVGALTGVAGSLAALAAIKTITGAGDDPTGELLLFDALHWRTRTVTIAADRQCRTCG